MISMDSEAIQRMLTFEDTLAQYFSSDTLQHKVQLSRNETEIVDFTDSMMSKEKVTRVSAANVMLTRESTLDAAQKSIHGKTAVLDFASATMPGGGVLIGSRGQEEDLCRYTTLYFNLNTDFLRENYYEKNKKDRPLIKCSTCIYIPDVQIIKNPENPMARFSEKQYFPIDVIVCAAPNLRKVSEIPTEDKLLAYHEERAKNIFQCAAKHGVSNLVLGAFGCGAFRNPPEIVAKAYKQVLTEYENLFESIIFAFNCVSEEDKNFSAFSHALRNESTR